jgi:hypothetical protein
MEGLENIFSQRIKQAHLQFAQGNAQTKNCKRAYFTNRTDTATLDGQTMTEREGRTHNSGFKKLAVQWLNDHSTSHQLLWWLDSFVLRNRQLLKPANR